VTSISVPVHTFRRVLEWIYTDSLEVTEVDLHLAFELYSFSLQYKLPKFRV
jgi:hypothetical protein